MGEHDIKTELFSKKTKIITVITCICAVALLVLQVYINYRTGASVGSM